ncbi:hypothetical protein JOB18_008080 [Solea senegalensis]|uniref:B-block binding subunit of TFIIIC domain-containing protein n=1 Tax=Solea senegalensis TaxID=28829 RepID=A0AAV6Q6B9_SOLSE|nr:hypothetical protein JOB18_008080 [Solea senegalensis]
MDALSAVADEVTLEGLDGITIPSLWVRLVARQPTFPFKLDDCSKEFIWKSLIHNTDLTFYELPEEREDVLPTDRFAHVDPDTGIETMEESFELKKDIYPIHIIQENKNGIQGSCCHFNERTEITKHLRSKSLTPLINLEETLQRYGRKLVVVASQNLRFRTLIGNEGDPDLKLTDDSYCLLERVGRARWQGALQSELHGNSFKTDARKLHYMRKSLVKHGLVSMQSHVRRLKTGQQQHSILLLLNRFHVNRRSKYNILMEQVSNLLQQVPGQCASLNSVKQQLNVNEGTSKRVFQYMRTAKLVEFCQLPVEEFDPTAKRFLSKNGNKLLVRVVRLLKPYSKKGVPDDDDDDDEEEEDYSGRRNKAFPPEGRIMEKDILSQAYHIVSSCGTKGTPQSEIAYRLNVGKLESRMLCRRLEREGLIKGFMVDVGRQRTINYITHKCVGASNQLQLFAKEQERKELLYSSAPQTSDKAQVAPKIPPRAKSTEKGKNKCPAVQKIENAGEGDKDSEEAGLSLDIGAVEVGDEELNQGKDKAGRKSGATRKSTVKTVVTVKEAQPDTPEIQLPPDESESPACSQSKTSMTPDAPRADQAGTAEDQSKLTTASSASQTVTAAEIPPVIHVVVVEDGEEDCQQKATRRSKSKNPAPRSHETYRLLKRKNLIVEAVRSLKVIEGLFPLQKMINEEEKQDGISSKCCKKTILRLVHSLSREGLLKIFKTTVIQDGITKKVEMIVHPSIQPSDDILQRLIEQVRFKISSSYTAGRLQQAEEKSRQEKREYKELMGQPFKAQKSEANKNKKDSDNFKPTTVKGQGKSFGFQPKMHRLRVIHTFLWYLIYGHPQRHGCTVSTTETLANLHSPVTTAPNPDGHENQDLKDTQDGQTQTDSTESKMDLTAGDEEEDKSKEATPGHSQSVMKVYADDESWKKFIPPVRVRKGFSSGWAMVGDLLLCLPLSIFIQVIRINYKVDGLEEYLNDPEKQHYLVRALPAKMRRQLLYKRKYLFSFHENLQRLIYMGLLQFGPVEKFQEKDQVFLYLRRNATIVDTTNAEPHYWLVTESPDKPFERRKYTFNTAEDVENYWFDLMCVCLNTPLGVIRSKRNVTEHDTAPSFVHDRNVFVGLSYMLKGSSEVCDEGTIPGDGKGAGGLDSEFFGHLKRNWLWTNHLLVVKEKTAAFEEKEHSIRLKSLLSKNALRFAFTAGGTTSPRYLTPKQPLVAEKVEVGIEPSTRNKKVVGGKGQKRKRTKKEVVKVPRKKKEPKKRTPAHDEVDHQALKMMTRHRVYWSVQEDSLMMLCSVASQLLNSKLKRPFVPYCFVRDLLHAEFEISADKTSVAVGRRTRYILKNPQTLLNFRICLAEVYQDKALMRQLEEEKPCDPNNLEDCAKAFSEYTKLLRQKFSSVMCSHDMIIPDTKLELFSRFKVSAIESRKLVLGKDFLNCTDDIHTIVLHNLIQSTLAMTNSQMKSSRSFQTFHMYSKYNQDLLCQVFIQCRKRGLVNRRRINQPFGPKKNRGLPILPMSYQMSQSYYRCFSWRFPHTLCSDSFRFLRTLINNGQGDNRPVTVFSHETESRSDNGEEVLEKQKGSNSKMKQSGGEASGTSVSHLDIKPKEVNTESAKDGENDQLMEVDLNSEAKTDEQKKQNFKHVTISSGEDPVSTEQTRDHLPKEGPSEVDAASNTAAPVSEDPQDASDLLRLSLDSPGGTCAVFLSLMTLGLLNVHVSVPKQMVLVDSSLMDSNLVDNDKSVALEDDDDDEEDGEECEGGKKLKVKAHQASHTKYLMMQGFCRPGIVRIRNLNTSDNIVLESCIIKMQLRNTPSHHMFTMENSPPLDLNKCGPSLLPSFLTSSICVSSSSHSIEECNSRLIEQRGYTPQDIEACAQIRRSLDEAGENGLYTRDLYQTYAHLVEPQSGRTRSLQMYMKDFQEEGQVLKVGAMGVHYVLIQHAEPWLLTINSKQWSQTRSSNRLPFFKKRRRQGNRQETEEPPAKKAATEEKEEQDAGEKSKDTTREEMNDEETQMENGQERTDEDGGERQGSLKEDGEKQTRQEHVKMGEEEAGEEKVGEGEKEGDAKAGEEMEEVEEEERQEEKRQLRSRENRRNNEGVEDAHSPPTGISDVEENMSFISRPWRMVDGKLNRLVCKGMLEALLYHIMSRPGLTQQSLVEHYKDVLQPMAVLELVQALIEMGCVNERTLVKCPKPSLFSRSVHQARAEMTEKKIEAPDTVFYEPSVSCCLQLCRVLPNERFWNDSLP